MTAIASRVSIAIILVATNLAFAQAPSQRIRGDVISIDGPMLQVKERSGETMSIKLADNYSVSAVVKLSIDAIKPGSYIGAASMPGNDGKDSALEVLVLPESGRGSGEGHYPSDLRPGSMMTNATVSEVTAIDDNRVIHVKYKDGERTIVVPPQAPIVTFEPGDRAMIKPGAHVLVNASRAPDGTLSAARIAVGKDGLVPPM
jgi:hypothetical protein